MRLPFHILRFTILQGFFFLSLDGMTPRSGLKEFGYDRRMSVSPRSRGAGTGADATLRTLAAGGLAHDMPVIMGVK